MSIEFKTFRDLVNYQHDDPGGVSAAHADVVAAQQVYHVHDQPLEVVEAGAAYGQFLGMAGAGLTPLYGPVSEAVQAECQAVGAMAAASEAAHRG